MNEYPISTACPQCGSADSRKRRLARECRVCRTHYRPPIPSWRRWAVGLGVILAGLLLCVASVVAIMEVASVLPAKQATDPFSYLCWGVLGLFGIFGLWCVVRGIKEIVAREVVTPSGAPLTDGTEPVAPPIRMIAAGRAEALLRQVAGRYGKPAILRQLGPLRPEGMAGPVSLDTGIYFVVSRRRQSTPSERLACAVRSFAREWDPGEIPLLFLNTSWRRNGRAGILVTNRRLYSSRLDGPIELQDVTRVALGNPSGAETIIMVLLFVILLPLGVILILRGPWFSRRLLVNGEVVYKGRADIYPDFWIELLTTLGEAARRGDERFPAWPAPEAAASQGITRHVGLLTTSPRDMWGGRARRQGVTALELLPHSAEGLPLPSQLFDAPSWEQVERSIRGLDGYTQPLVRLWAGQPREAPGTTLDPIRSARWETNLFPTSALGLRFNGFLSLERSEGGKGGEGGGVG